MGNCYNPQPQGRSKSTRLSKASGSVPVSIIFKPETISAPEADHQTFSDPFFFGALSSSAVDKVDSSSLMNINQQ